MTMISLPLWQLLAMAGALVALLFGVLKLGWRLGRESQGKPVWSATTKPEQADVLPAESPWDLAATLPSDKETDR